jgi:hypothetical protein
MLENIIEEIGLEMSGKTKVHYCIPILTIGKKNGLRDIRDDDDDDTKFMVTFGTLYTFCFLSVPGS